MSGRPTKLTKALVAKLKVIADDELTIKETCEQLKIGETAWRRWEALPSDNAIVKEFQTLSARVREGSGKRIDRKAWGALETVLDDPEASNGDKIAAARAIVGLRNAHKIEITGRDGGPLEVNVENARNRLMQGVVLDGADGPVST